MLGEFATEEGYTHERLAEYKRALDALEKQGLKDYRVAVKLTGLGLTLDKSCAGRTSRRSCSTPRSAAAFSR